MTDDGTPTWTGVRLTVEEAGLDVVATVADSDAATDAAAVLRPDIALLDVGIPGGGIEAAAAIKAIARGVRVVLLATNESEAGALAALRAGADGYLCARMDPARFVPTLEGVVDGEVALSRHMVARLVAAYRSERSGPDVGFEAMLTDREREILAHLLAGETTGQVAYALGLTDVTVRRHVSGIIRKSGQPDRVSALRFARRERTAAGERARDTAVHAA